MKLRRILEISLLGVIVLLGYLSVRSIQEPIEFRQFKKERYEVVKTKLEKIRTAQFAYKKKYRIFIGSMDSLIYFVKNETLTAVKKIGELSDSLIEEGYTEARALEEGLIIRDTSQISVLESLFGIDYNIDDIKYVPLTNNEVQFEMGATIVETGSKVKVPVFEVKVHNDIILHGFENIEYIKNLNIELKVDGKYPGLKIGSLTETNNSAANW